MADRRQVIKRQEAGLGEMGSRDEMWTFLRASKNPLLDVTLLNFKHQ